MRRKHMTDILNCMKAGPPKPEETKEYYKGVCDGIQLLLCRAEQDAVKPDPISETQFEPFIEIKVLKTLIPQSAYKLFHD